MLKFAIIDDDTFAVSSLSHLLESIFIQNNYDANICIATSNISNFLEYIEKESIDVFIFDIELKSSINGIEIAERVRKYNKNCYFIFITAYTDYGLDAFKCKTFDFISKPIERQKIELSINRLFEDINGLPKKFIKLDNKNTIIDESKIKYIERNGMKLVFHTDSRNYEIYSSFNKIQNTLPTNFVRCHKSFIANISNITKVEPLNNIVYFDNASCDIGPKYKQNFMEVIKDENFK